MGKSLILSHCSKLSEARFLDGRGEVRQKAGIHASCIRKRLNDSDEAIHKTQARNYCY